MDNNQGSFVRLKVKHARETTYNEWKFDVSMSEIWSQYHVTLLTIMYEEIENKTRIASSFTIITQTE